MSHLKNSSYFIQESEKDLKGEISLDESTTSSPLTMRASQPRKIEAKRRTRFLFESRALLVKEGKLERVGGKKYGHWEVKQG